MAEEMKGTKEVQLEYNATGKEEKETATTIVTDDELDSEYWIVKSEAANNHNVYEACYSTALTIDAKSATDEELAAALKAADHSATFATYEEAEAFIREGKAAAGEAFEGGRITTKDGGTIKQVNATAPTLEEMGVKVTDILSEIDCAKSTGDNITTRKLECKLGKVHQNYYYSIVYFGVDITNEQFEFAYNRAIVLHNAKKEMARRNSEEYKAAVKAEAEYDAKKASAIIKANAGVDGIEYVEGVKKLLDTAILSGNCSDIVCYCKELQRVLAKMPKTPTNEEMVVADTGLNIKTAIETDNAEKAYEAAKKEVQLEYSATSEERWSAYGTIYKDRVVEATLGRKTTKQIISYGWERVSKADAAEILGKYGLTTEQFTEMQNSEIAAANFANWAKTGWTAESLLEIGSVDEAGAEEYRAYLEKINISAETSKVENIDNEIDTADDVKESAIVVEAESPQIDSDAAITALSTLAVSALTALFNIVKAPVETAAPAVAEEAPAVQPIEKPVEAKSELDATRGKIAKVQEAIKKNTRRLRKLDAKVHGLGTELDFYATEFNAALDDSAIWNYAEPMEELAHIASQIGARLAEKAKAEINVATLRTRIEKAKVKLARLTGELASLESQNTLAA